MDNSHFYLNRKNAKEKYSEARSFTSIPEISSCNFTLGVKCVPGQL